MGVPKQGDRIVVISQFSSNSIPSVRLPEGLLGEIISIDVDGDAEIRFDTSKVRQWIFHEQFTNLKIRIEVGAVFTESSGVVFPSSIFQHNNSTGIPCLKLRQRTNSTIAVDTDSGEV